MPGVKRLHSGDTSPCVSADCDGATESAGVSSHGQLLDGLKTSSRSEGPQICGAVVHEPCSSLEEVKKDALSRGTADVSRGMHRHAVAHLPRLVRDVADKLFLSRLAHHLEEDGQHSVVGFSKKRMTSQNTHFAPHISIKSHLHLRTRNDKSVQLVRRLNFSRCSFRLILWCHLRQLDYILYS